MDQGLSRERLAVSHRMQRALAQAGYTQVEAARKANVARGYVHKAVQRGSVPRDKHARDTLAEILGVTSSWLWYAQETATPEAAVTTDVAGNQNTSNAPTLSGAHHAQAPTVPPDPQGYVLVVSHDDFAPIARENDYLWITPSYRPRSGDRVFVTTDRGEEGIYVLIDENDEEYVLSVPGSGRARRKKTDVKRLHKISGVVFK